MDDLSGVIYFSLFTQMKQAMSPNEFQTLIQKNNKFLSNSLPVDQSVTPLQIKDAEFLIRNDGIIFNIEGYCHPKGKVVGEVLYAPDTNGDKTIFGLPYRKVTLYEGTYEPVPYTKRAEVLKKIDPLFAENSQNPYYAKYKQILPFSDFIAYVPSRRAFEKAIRLDPKRSIQFRSDLANLLKLLDLEKDEVELGLTGAPLLGNTSAYHDLDIVFSGDELQNLKIAKIIRQLTTTEPDRRLFEGGKAWQIRFFNDNKTLMCTFFTYADQKSAPLHDFTMDVIQDDMEIQGTVADDTHTMYTPTILHLENVIFQRNGKTYNSISSLPLIIYHTASRGDCFNGDIVSAKGALVKVNDAQKGPYEAFCVIDREGVRNLTPPWKDYYAE